MQIDHNALADSHGQKSVMGAELPKVEISTQEGESRTKFDAQAMWRKFGIYVILLIFGIGLTVTSNNFLTWTNLVNVVQQFSVLGLIALGMLIVVITGNIDLTVGALLSLVGVVMALTAEHLPVGLAIAAGFGVAVVSGLVAGYLSTRGRNLSIIVTLSMLTIIEGISLLVTNGQPVVYLNSTLLWIGNQNVAGLPASVIVFVVAAVSVWLFLSQSRLGRELYAVGGNPEASRLAGIPVKRRVVLAYVISGLLAALAGLILLGQVASAQPTAGVGQELYAVGAVLIGGASVNGGMGRVGKTVAGVMILGFISDGINLLSINAFVAYVVQGGVILVAILLDQWERKGSR